ncbi:MAG: protein phosphatase 2C domain-containing protein [Longimicrobiales bacterium]|nr:protein phosphatase 2C domain-containing protein [Longimicrobiales bacterium]
MGRIVRPQFSQIDAWGMTHAGKVRDANEDHFFVGAIARGVTVDATSIDEKGRSVLHAERLASLAMVADGVGGRAGGEEAARLAVQTLISKVSESFYEADYLESEDPEVFARLLHEAALDCHEELLDKAEQEGAERKFSTTLTLFLGLWPHAYLLQVGDSRCYILRDGELTQITRDQTIAQELIDSGSLTQTVANKTRWAHVLSSSIGGEQAAPVVTRVTRDWGNVVLLCSDGLTKHVSDDRIRERLASLTDARSACEQLIQDALDDGGTDNITVIVGRPTQDL